MIAATSARPRALTIGSRAYAARAVAATEAFAAAIGAAILQAGGRAVATTGRRRAWRLPTRAGWATVVVWVSENDAAYARGDLDVFHRFDEPARAAPVAGCHPTTGVVRYAYGDGDHVPAASAAARWRASIAPILLPSGVAP